MTEILQLDRGKGKTTQLVNAAISDADLTGDFVAIIVPQAIMAEYVQQKIYAVGGVHRLSVFTERSALPRLRGTKVRLYIDDADLMDDPLEFAAEFTVVFMTATPLQKHALDLPPKQRRKCRASCATYRTVRIRSSVVRVLRTSSVSSTNSSAGWRCRT